MHIFPVLQDGSDTREHGHGTSWGVLWCGSSVFALGIPVCSQVKLEMEILIWVGYGECGGQLIITDRIKDDIASRFEKKVSVP